MSNTTTTARSGRRTRLRGAERAKITARLVDDYGQGATIRALRDQYGMSYGLTRTLLLEGGVTLRPRPRTRGAER